MESKIKLLEKILSKRQIRYEKNVSLKNLTTFGTGGPAKFLIEIKNTPELIKTLNFLREIEMKYRVLGSGSNVLAQDKGYNGAIVKLKGKFIKFYLSSFKNQSTVYAGANLMNLCQNASFSGHSGIENLAGIPGTVGGAIFGNAGAAGTEIKDVIESVCYLDENLHIKVLNKEDCNFSYRGSIFKQMNYIILSAKLNLQKIQKEISIAKFNEAVNTRKTAGLEGRNAGSIFKNPKGDYAGRLIEEAGFKGYETDNIIVSNKHSNIICAKNNMATSGEILETISKIQKEVYNKFRIKLEKEIQIL